MMNEKKQSRTDRRRDRIPVQASIFPEYQPETITPLNGVQKNIRWVMGFCLVVSDVISILVSFYLAITLRALLLGEISGSLYLELITFVIMFVFIFAAYGLYPGVGLSPVDEIKKHLEATSTVFLLILAYTFFQQTSATYSRLVIGLAWLISLVVVQLNRWVLRITARDLGFWGEPVVIVGNGPIGRKIAEYLKNNLRLGMKPHSLLSGQESLSRITLQSINTSKISTAILIIPEMSEKLQQSFIYQQRYGYFRRKGESSILRLILVSSLSWVGSLGITVHDLDGMLGLEIRQNLLQTRNQIAKRAIDLLITFTFGLLSLPVLLLMSVIIAIDSPGGVIYKQKRIGLNGETFEMWKFRTMFKNADLILEKYLDENPDMRNEWRDKQKLQHDPRITRVGAVLRKLSLDELPQLVNILRGEMSFVGPRPFFLDQQKIYGTSLNLYYRVRPGLTGMWQVMGRNSLSFRERVRLDEYYIRNWSIWLDIYIILRTFWVVIRQKGAY